ncbi:hypothetical protein FACS189447_09230 [Spirochaetia bacterium]|nr:hypothetical protein FACS189447_09230 [Spirochaetia bacterium]
MHLFEPGKFFVGCNYWASHAGTNMWSDWQANVVEDDFKRLAEKRIVVLRVFPLWPVFQPIALLRGGGGIPREYRFGEDPIPDTEEGYYGMSASALDHFEEFCALAEKYKLRLIVGLITGWMSGRLYVPPALEGLNVLTDPAALLWETRFIRCFVKRFRNSPAVAAWDLGNECNCIAPVKNADEFYAWVSNITGAIRSTDPSRPVVSGMHSLLPDNNWTIQHQAELTDILTTHPYPYFTPHCDRDPINTMRTELHATAETLFYRGIGGKPCFVEECGTLGPMFADEERAADFLRVNLFSQWAHNCLGFLWWCANEQSHLIHAPYDWNAVERELGLFRADHSPKPVLNVLHDFSSLVESFDFKTLPPRITDGVCILTRGQDSWGAAYMTFILAKQAGLDIEFSWADQNIPDSPLYLLPSLAGDAGITQRRFQKILEKVREGAVLYLSMESGLLSPFSEFTGARVITRQKTGYTEPVKVKGEAGDFKVDIYSAFKFKLELCGASALAEDGAGNPVYTVYRYGKGFVYFLAMPLETGLLNVSDAFAGDKRYSDLYLPFISKVSGKKAARILNRNIGLTEHIIDDKQHILVLVNYAPYPEDAELRLASGWKVSKFYQGALKMPNNSGTVALISRE